MMIFNEFFLGFDKCKKFNFVFVKFVCIFVEFFFDWFVKFVFSFGLSFGFVDKFKGCDYCNCVVESVVVFGYFGFFK